MRYVRLMSSQIRLSVVYVCSVVAPYLDGLTFLQYFAPSNSN